GALGATEVARVAVAERAQRVDRCEPERLALRRDTGTIARCLQRALLAEVKRHARDAEMIVVGRALGRRRQRGAIGAQRGGILGAQEQLVAEAPRRRARRAA